MKAAGGGSIINFSSISTAVGNGDYPSYVAAKAGITGLTRGLARELGPDRIRVNALLPGWVLTQRQVDLWATPEDAHRASGAAMPEGHLAERDIVDPRCSLASTPRG